jgi:hypothetical protein
MLMRLTLVVLTLLALTAPTFAKTMQAGPVTFEALKGWEVERTDDSLLLTRTWPETDDTSEMSALIQIVTVDNAQPQSLAANLSEMVAGIPELAGEDPMTESEGVTVNGHPIRVEMRCCDHSRDVSISQTVAAIAGERDQVLAALVIINTRSDHEDAADAEYEKLVRSIRFEGDDNTQLLPVAGDGGIDGVYTHLATGLMPNVFGGLDFTVDNEIAYFAPDGLMSDTLPPNGDLAAHCEANPTDCGTYKLTGGWFGASEIEMHRMSDAFGTVEVETVSFARKGDDLALGEEDYFRIPAFEDGTTFDGTWTYTYASSGMTATSSGGIAIERTLRLSPDGTFTRDGWSGASSTFETGGVTTSSDRPASEGTYSVSGYTLTLKGDDGTEEQLSIFAPEKDSDDLLVIGGSNYLKED